jgi:hypothetical protein
MAALYFDRIACRSAINGCLYAFTRLYGNHGSRCG